MGDSASHPDRRRLALLMLGLVLLVSAWVAGTRPFDAPDEASHYQRALTITHGQILGPKVDYPNVPMTPTQQAFINHDTRAVLMPARLSPPDVVCIDGKPDLSGSCLEADPNGNFPPLPYLLPAAALAVSHDAATGLWLTRAASALPSLGFLLLAVALLWTGSGWSLLGLLAASTPMVLFTSSVLNSSGPQITACLAFAAAALRITRGPADAPRWVWLAFAGTGVAAILSGPLGLEFAIFQLLVAGVLLSRDGFQQLRSLPARRAVVLSASVLLVAGIVSLVYARIAGFAPSFGISPFWHSLRVSLDQLPEIVKQAIGNFGSLTVPLPRAACWIWSLLVLGLIAAGLWLGTRHERLVIVAVSVLALAFPVLFYAWIDRYTGYGLQGREVLPVLMLIPLTAGEVVSRHSLQLAALRSAQAALAAATALFAALQAYAWWYNARTMFGGPGAIGTYALGTWSPPGGWAIWGALAGLGTIALLVFAATEGAMSLPARTAPSRLRRV
jgi:hypothetical protein